MWQQKLILFFLFLFVSCEYTESEPKERSRKPKLFTFQTVDDDVRVELSFTIPFLTIPAKKAFNSVYGAFSGEADVPSININPASLAVGGAIILASTIVLPLVIKSFAYHNQEQRYSRVIDDTQFSTEAFLEFANRMLADGKSVHGCMMRVACWAGHRSTKDSVRFWHHFKNNALVSSMLNATAIEEAMHWGREGRDCMSFTPCPLQEDQFPVLMESLDRFIRSVR